MNAERLLQLADHLDHGQLGHEVFDFSEVNTIEAPKCGTAGCGMGELPILHPSDWTWSDMGNPLLIDSANGNMEEDVMYWFEIEMTHMDHLFFPNLQNPDEFGGSVLGCKATRYDVAAHIREFVKRNQ